MPAIVGSGGLMLTGRFQGNPVGPGTSLFRRAEKVAAGAMRQKDFPTAEAILHFTPEAADGDPLALIRDGDLIAVAIDARSLHLDVSDKELAPRRAGLVVEIPPVQSGYQHLYQTHVQQAGLGCDFDFAHYSSELTRQRVSH